MKKISIDEYHKLCEESCGVCLQCGEIRYGDTEPDAENYPCEECGTNNVQGIENALIAGNIEVVES